MTIKSQKLFTLALMFLGGCSRAEMARRMGWAVRTIDTHLRSELFRAQLVELKEHVAQDTIQAVLKRIDDEALPALQILVEEAHRDIDTTDPKKAALIAQRRAAAEYLLGSFKDIRIPRLQREGAEGIHVSLSAETLQEMFQALAEFKGESITVPFKKLPTIAVEGAVPAKRRQSKPAPIIAHDADALAAEFAEQEALESA